MTAEDAFAYLSPLDVLLAAADRARERADGCPGCGQHLDRCPCAHATRPSDRERAEHARATRPCKDDAPLREQRGA